MEILPFKNPNLTVEERLEDLIARMTLHEKAEQLVQVRIGQDWNINNRGSGSFRPTIGSLLGGAKGAAENNKFQKAAMEESRLGIPIIFGMDIIHGCVTIYQHSLGQACSFRPDLARVCARQAALEALAMGFNWTFSPMVDVCRDPRWGRGIEGYGEDPLVNMRFGVAAIEGYQNGDLSAPDSIAACLKHFAGYGWSEGGRDYCYTDISDRTLWESVLPPFKAGIEAGAATVMSSFNDIGGTPAVIHHHLLTDILRDAWGFEGFVVSDWNAVSQLAAQGVSSDPLRQTKLCLEAGNDMDMASEVYLNIPELLQSGDMDVSVVDESVRRVLRLKFKLGLFENPYFEEISFEEAFLKPDTVEAAEHLASESFVLLKNEREVFPCSTQSMALIGPGADDQNCLLGSWPAYARLGKKSSIHEGLLENFTGTINYSKGCDFDGDDDSGFAEAIEIAQSSDMIVLCLGEHRDWSGENSSRASIELPPIQEKLLDALLATSKPIALVLVHGRPLGLEAIAPKVDGILSVWQPGSLGGFTIAKTILGINNPSGKLAMTFPRSTGHIPTYYSEHQHCRPESGNYMASASNALFEFGHGLSYTSFQISPISLSKDSVSEGETLMASVTVTNTGQRDGAETIFWYLGDPEATITQPFRRLIDFKKIDLKPGEFAEVQLEIDPMIHLSYPNSKGERILEEGRFILEANRLERCEFVLMK